MTELAVCTSKSWGLARCDACGTAFTAPPPDDATRQEVYRSCFNYDWYRDRDPARSRDAGQRLSEYPYLPAKRVLDFHGGVGYFSEVARAAGHQSTTFDPFSTGAMVEAADYSELQVTAAVPRS
jgi:hypothetical protein